MMYMKEKSTYKNFIKKNPANIVRYDLESYDPGNRGILFQNRKRFPSTI